MRKNILIVSYALLVLCFSSCIVVSFTGTDAVAGKGALEKYEITVGEYNRIRAEGVCEIQYYAAPLKTVTLEVQPNLREYYVVEVKNGELIISTTKSISYNSGKTPVLTVSTPVLNSLILDGTCAFNANDKIKTDTFNLEISGVGSGQAELDVNSLKASISGVGRFELYGRADTAEIELAGTGELNASSLQVREASVELSGAGTVRIYCSEKLSIEASGAGMVEYKGSPSLILDTNGPVRIKKVD